MVHREIIFKQLYLGCFLEVRMLLIQFLIKKEEIITKKLLI